ncbi:hypothetical protein GCM10010168_74200 [Actinoplanes ianthinogenes]|uniref:Excreted virulence factor EspC (Type VII ESX diderm) n=1 Tax=Actinoplanes ianthinogenes TaxID=122358 RepID=A0ABM7LN02_9ACTN|nr:hypothetical protein [Actinoplanes ianthinogenes]BCJ40592.1 hypothetical protein Aiant_12490 [Actinoplanes ianthinogenes]GGR44268.1 hypothetical protein GCM10010168_74200 [Actinoplanes ianthinogenes]
MTDEMRGAVLGGPLERLRQAARVDLPRLADEYAGLRNECETSSGSDDRLDRPAHFGAPALKESWTRLRDLVWTAAGETSDNLWDLSRGLDYALDRFVQQDTEAADALRATRWTLEHDRTTTNDEWTAGHDGGHYPHR